jgi:DNA-binding response OmpR family regulator
LHVLIVEDDVRLGRLMKRVLEEDSHVVEVAVDGGAGLELAQTGTFDVLILDVLLPTLDGVEVCRRLRAARVDTPVLMLTARDAAEDRVADDYVGKPFSFAELLARLRALARRRPVIISEVLTIDDLSLDPVRHMVLRAGREVDLSPKEFALLEYLMRHPGQVLTRTQLLDHVWGYAFNTMSNVVDIYVHYLRNKIDHGHTRKLIRTVRGFGYKIEAGA